MRDRLLASVAPGASLTAGQYVGREVAILAGRLARMLGETPVSTEASVAPGIAFLRVVAQSADGERPLSERLITGTAECAYPIERIAAAYSLAPVEIDLLLLAGLAEEHEGFASLFRTLHPRGEPRPTASLAPHLMC